MALKMSSGGGADNKLDAYFKGIIQKHIAAMQRTGEQFVNDARSSHRWQNRTGNLESSLGYLIALDGSIITNGITGTTIKGKEEALALAKSQLESNGLYIVGVAGMQYAAALEAKGYNVITVQGKWAVINLKDRIAKVK
jgi:hypothetical protein